MSSILSHHAGGIDFRFGVLDAASKTWPPGSGLYMMCRLDTVARKYIVLYIGQATDFKSRLSNHERWSEALQRGMTHVLVTTVLTQPDRDKLEEILIKDQDPPMNVQLRTISGLAAALYGAPKR